jgi:hypothetical protein
VGTPNGPGSAAQLERELAPARRALGAERFGAAWAAGEATPLDQAIDAALEEGLDG